MAEALELTTADGLALEGELAVPTRAPRCAMVLCHPHPQFGGSMQSIVISALFSALPDSDVACLRFNFRGVEGSEGSYSEGVREVDDVRAAIAALGERIDPEMALVLTGWSFGADMALSVREERVAAWMAIAPPFRFVRDPEGLAHDPRPKLFALAEHDEFRPPPEVRAMTKGWTRTETEVVRGASHFFVGRTDRLVVLASRYVDRLLADAVS